MNSGSIIDWRNILDSYSASSNDAQKKAIADLMLFCSNSIKSDYIDLKQGTSASMEYCPMALVDYFGSYAFVEITLLLLVILPTLAVYIFTKE